MSSKSGWLECCKRCGCCFCRCKRQAPEVVVETDLPRSVQVADFNYQTINQPAVIDHRFGSLESKGYKVYVDPLQRQAQVGREVSVGESKVDKPKFITFRKLGLREQEKQQARQKAGWKFHLSINDLIEGNLAKAWNALWPILRKYGIVETKVVPYNTFHGRPSKTNKQSEQQVGKQITIYAFSTVFAEDSEANIKQWVNFLQEVDRALVEAKVVPGPAAGLDHILDNSRYISYCNDAGERGHTYDYHHGFNNYNHDDPFKGLNYQFRSDEREAKIERQPDTIDEYQRRVAKHLEKTGLWDSDSQQPGEKAEEKIHVVDATADVFSAITSKDIDQTVRLIGGGVSLTMKDSDGLTVLERAQDTWGPNSLEVMRLQKAAIPRPSTSLQAPSDTLQSSSETASSSTTTSSTMSRSYSS